MHPAVASYYGVADSGGPLACGGNLTSSTLGVANRTLPCGHRLRVCARRCLMVRVIDRGPYVAGRDFDLTEATARAIGFDMLAGVGPIRVSA
jgi:rare lipoprotein A